MYSKSFVGKLMDFVAAAFFRRWKIFLLSLIFQFLISAFIHLGIRTPKLLSFLVFPRFTVSAGQLTTPLPSRADILETLLPKLRQKENNFRLKREVGLVPRAFALGEAEPARAYMAIDLVSGKVLAERNSSKKLPIASLTKIMTAVVTLDLAASEDKFTVSPKAAAALPTKIGVVAGQKMGRDELLNALMLTSANDAAQVISEGVDRRYRSEIFVKAMNAKAEFLGLRNTRFSNPQGFDDRDNFSSAEDMTMLARYALAEYPEFAGVVQRDYYFIESNNNHKQFDLYNWNGLIGVYPGVYGVKIGNTDDAGYTTVVASEREGRHVLAVVLGAPGVYERDLWAAGLLDLGFSRLGLDPVNITRTDLQTKYSTWKFWG